MRALISELTKLVESLSAVQVEIIGLFLVLLGAGVDLYTSDGYSPLLIYILPAIFVAWASQRARGWILIGVIAVATFAIAFFEDLRQADWAKVYNVVFNSATEVATIALVYWAVRRLRTNTRDLEAANVRLEALNRQLEALNHEKNILFGIISHDLRSPLSVMLTFSRLITNSTDRVPAETIQKLAREHQAAAQKILGLLENLLEWARVQMSSFTLVPHPVEVEVTIHSGIEPLRAAAAEKGIALREDVQPGLRLIGDERALASVVRNLVSNAIKFTAPGGRVCVEARANDGHVIINVHDTGVGMAKELTAALFSPKGTVPSLGTGGEAGAGFGLLLCKEIVERIGGSISVQSELGAGTRFAIAIPRCPEREHRGRAA